MVCNQRVDSYVLTTYLPIDQLLHDDWGRTLELIIVILVAHCEKTLIGKLLHFVDC